MKNFPMENLTELSPNELNEVQGGGLLTNVVTGLSNLLQNLPNTVGGVGTTLKNLVDFLI
jgi:hypothetical protein